MNHTDFKKTTILFFIVTLFSYAGLSQQIDRPGESEYLVLDKFGKYYQVLDGDTINVLKVVRKTYEYEETGMTVAGSDTTFHFAKKEVFNKSKLNARDYKTMEKRLYGDFVQEGSMIKFYPWKFNVEKDEKNKVTDTLFSREDYYVIDIPKGVELKTHYNSGHFGIMTIPAKFYYNRIDTVSNTQFGPNLNLMFGKKKGKKKYYYDSNNRKSSYTLAASFNVVLGLSKLTLNPSNTNNEVRGEKNVAMLTYGVAIGLHYKKVGLFLVTGIDRPLSSVADKWIYENPAWFGVGLGLGI